MNVGVCSLGVTPTQLRMLRAFLRAVAVAEPLQSELNSSHGISLGDM